MGIIKNTKIEMLYVHKHMQNIMKMVKKNRLDK